MSKRKAIKIVAGYGYEVLMKGQPPFRTHTAWIKDKKEATVCFGSTEGEAIAKLLDKHGKKLGVRLVRK